MSIFYKSGFERVSVLGTPHSVRGHWVSRDEWGKETRGGVSIDAKASFLFGEFRRGKFGTSVTKPTTCPDCGDPVFFYRNECGGAVWFDSLGWPWPKHPCMDVEDSACSFEYFNRQDAKAAEEARLKRLSVQKEKARDEAKARRRSQVQLWQVYGAARFYRVKYEHYWEPEWYMPDEFFLTPRDLLLRVAKSMKTLDVFSPKFDDGWDIRRGCPAKLYGPRKSKLIASYFEGQPQTLFGFVQQNGSTIYSYPLRFLRAVKIGKRFYIAAVSELYPWVGLWLESEIGLRHFRNRHALLEWTPERPESMQLNYISFRQGRLNWREVKLAGLFDGRRAKNSTKRTTEKAGVK